MAVIRVDGSCYQQEGHGGWAVEVRSYNANYIKSGHLYTSSSRICEQIAFFNGLQEAMSIRDRVIELFTDYYGIIDTIKRQDKSKDIFDTQIIVTLNDCKAKGKIINPQWIDRSRIGRAHVYAKKAAQQR